MRLIDTHIHLTSPRYADLPGLVLRAQQAGIVGALAVAVDEATSIQILSLRDTFPDFVHVGLGVHPERPVSLEEEARVMTLIRQQRPRLVAVAEVGLPWYSLRERPDREALIAASEPRLQRFLRLAHELDLAVVLHAPHETAARALSLLRSEHIERAVFHWHKAPLEVTQAIVEHGYYISVTPETCYRDRDRKLVASVPLDHLVVETDGPWPYGGEFEGQLTEPVFVARIVDAIATIKGVAQKEVAAIVTQNTKQLFRIS